MSFFSRRDKKIYAMWDLNKINKVDMSSIVKRDVQVLLVLELTKLFPFCKKCSTICLALGKLNEVLPLVYEI